MNRSLQWRLSVSLTGFVLVAGVLAAIASYVAAYREAHELQDALLQQVAGLTSIGNLVVDHAPFPTTPPDDPDAQVIVEPLDELGHGKSNPSNRTAPPGLSDGLHTLMLAGQSWRVMVKTQKFGRRIAVRQLTDVRDETARDSALRTLLPLLALIPLLEVWLLALIRGTFSPVWEMGRALDETAREEPPELPTENVPSEVLPFVLAVNRLLTRVRTSLAQQRRFIADATHELRTPIAALSLQAQNLRSIEMDEEGQQRLQALLGGLQRTKRLLEQLLSLSRLQMQPADGRCCRVEEVVSAVMTEVMPLACDKGIDLGIIHMAAARIPCSELDFHLLVSNAVVNAIRHTQTGGRIDISVENIDSHVSLYIEDTGSGIDPVHIPHLFETFYKAPAEAQPGTGLGLAIVKAVACRAGGSVSLNNRCDGQPGATFKFECPAVQEDLAA